MAQNTGTSEKHDDFERESTFEEFDERYSRLDPTYHSRIIEYLAKSSLQANDAQYYLYKYENYMSGEAKALIAKYVEADPPDEHEVGLQYGSGRYMLMMLVPPGDKRDKLIRSFRFRIHPHYDTVRNQNPGIAGGNSSMMPPVIIQEGGRKDSLVEAFGMMQNMLTTLIPLMRPPESPDVSRMMNQNYTLMSDVMKKTMLGNVDMMQDFQRKLAALKQPGGETVRNQDDDGNDEGNVASIIQQVIPYLEPWLPKLLGGGPQAKAVSNVVKQTDVFKEISRNQKMLSGLIAYLDNEKGQEETDKILNALGMRRRRAIIKK